MTARGMVSIVLIFLDAERFLEEAVESVFSQTYPHWELLLVDDGSRDGSTAIARQYARRHWPRVHYLEHPGHRNRGMSAARNLGIRHARGDYLAFLDADDVFLPEKLADQVPLLVAYREAGMVCGTHQVWYGWTGRSEDLARDYVADLGVTLGSLVEPPLLLTIDLERRASTPAISALLVRREVVERVGGFEDSFRGMYEDQAFRAKVYLTAPVFVTDRCASRYRQHQESCVIMARKTGRAKIAEMFYLKWLKRYLRVHGTTEPRLWMALRTRLDQTRTRAAAARRRKVRTLVAQAARRVLPEGVYRGLREGWPRGG